MRPSRLALALLLLSGCFSPIRGPLLEALAAPTDAPGPEPPTCNARPVNLAFQFDPATTDGDRALMREALKLARSYFPLRFPRFVRYSYAGERYICFPDHHIEPVKTTAEIPPHTGIAFYRPGEGITVYIATSYWRNATESYRYTVMFHEAYHWYQELASKSEQTLNGFRRTNPLWLIEGTAEWFGHEAAVHFGFYPSMDDARAYEASRLRHGAKELKSFEMRDRPSGDAYALFFTAVDRLIRDHGGIGALRRYWAFEDDDVDWRVVFRESFGISVAKFYGEFDV
ncbi:MAG: hypothetical protein WD770_09365 [Actinomycetota bacterium]